MAWAGKCQYIWDWMPRTAFRHTSDLLIDFQEENIPSTANLLIEEKWTKTCPPTCHNSDGDSCGTLEWEEVLLLLPTLGGVVAVVSEPTTFSLLLLLLVPPPLFSLASTISLLLADGRLVLPGPPLLLPPLLPPAVEFVVPLRDRTSPALLAPSCGSVGCCCGAPSAPLARRFLLLSPRVLAVPLLRAPFFRSVVLSAGPARSTEWKLPCPLLLAEAEGAFEKGSCGYISFCC